MSVESPLSFVDTNILVYALELGTSPKKQIAERLIAELTDENRLRLSTQVLQELFVTLTKKVARPCTPEDARAVLDHLTAWPFFVVDYKAIRAAIDLAGDANLSFWDALIVVSAERAGAAILYTEDLNHGQQLLGVRVTNPFRPETS